MSNTNSKIIIDTREQTDKFVDIFQKWAAELPSDKIPEIEIAKLEYGDYQLITKNYNMIIERKEYHDYLSSIGEYLKQRLEHMRQENQLTGFLLEGYPLKYDANVVYRNSSMGLVPSIRYSAYKNFTLSQQLNSDTIILHTKDFDESVLCLISTWNYLNKKKINNKTHCKVNDGATWLLMCPFVGKNKVEQLKKEYTSCYHALMSIDEWADGKTMKLIMENWQ